MRTGKVGLESTRKWNLAAHDAGYLSFCFQLTLARLRGWLLPSFPMGKLNLEKTSRDPGEERRVGEDPLNFLGYVTAGWRAAAVTAMEVRRFPLGCLYP